MNEQQYDEAVDALQKIGGFKADVMKSAGDALQAALFAVMMKVMDVQAPVSTEERQDAFRTLVLEALDDVLAVIGQELGDLYHDQESQLERAIEKYEEAQETDYQHHCTYTVGADGRAW